MDLTTRYLGLTLDNPLMLGASPLVDDLDEVRRAEDSGAAAIVMHSLFEEQVTTEPDVARDETHDGTLAEALYFRPQRAKFALGPCEYLEQIRRIKDAVRVPVIASLNGVTNGAWLEYARAIDRAGADALELNVYRVASHPDESAEQIERTTLEMLGTVKAATTLPVAVKLSPFYTSLTNFAARLANARADGLVLFNRFYQPDIDLEKRELSHRLQASGSAELLLRLRWLAILSAQLDVSLAVSGGVHSAADALKAILAGAHGVQIVSAVLDHGVQHFASLRAELTHWLNSHDFSSLEQARGCMDQSRCPDPAAYERASYMRVLQSYRPASR